MNEEMMAQMQGGGQAGPGDIAAQNAQMLQQIGQIVTQNNQMLQEIGQMIAQAMGEEPGMEEGGAAAPAGGEEEALRQAALARLAQQRG